MAPAKDAPGSRPEPKRTIAAVSSNPSLPGNVKPLVFAQARARELRVLESSIAAKVSRARAFQTIPEHLRRRAMSHNPHLLPARLRARAFRESEHAPPKKPGYKYLSRRARRRPKNLRLISQRQRAHKHKWLPTHLWQAKRMHIITMFGWRVPVHTSQRGERAALRAARHACTVRDVSFRQSVVFPGSLVNLEFLKSVISPEARNRLSCLDIANGSRVIHCGAYLNFPVGYLGPCAVQITKTGGDGEGEQMVMLTAHSTAISLLTGALRRKILDSPSPLAGLLSAFETPMRVGVLEVRGRKSADILARILAAPEAVSAFTSEVVRCSVANGALGSSCLMPRNIPKVFPSSNASVEDLLALSPKWGAVGMVAAAACGAGFPVDGVVAGEAVDPRVLAPPPKVPLHSVSDPSSLPGIASHPLWGGPLSAGAWWAQPEPEMGEDGADPRYFSKSQINKVRSQCARPAAAASLILSGDAGEGLPSGLIPFTLTRRQAQPTPGSGKAAAPHGSGFDLYAPLSVIGGIFEAAVLCGARAIGLSEATAASDEAGCGAAGSGSCPFPNREPDSIVASLMEAAAASEASALHQRTPAGKRTPYGKMGTKIPFHAGWKAVTLDGNDGNHHHFAFLTPADLDTGKERSHPSKFPLCSELPDLLNLRGLLPGGTGEPMAASNDPVTSWIVGSVSKVLAPPPSLSTAGRIFRNLRKKSRAPTKEAVVAAALTPTRTTDTWESGTAGDARKSSKSGMGEVKEKEGEVTHGSVFDHLTAPQSHQDTKKETLLTRASQLQFGDTIGAVEEVERFSKSAPVVVRGMYARRLHGLFKAGKGERAALISGLPMSSPTLKDVRRCLLRLKFSAVGRGEPADFGAVLAPLEGLDSTFVDASTTRSGRCNPKSRCKGDDGQVSEEVVGGLPVVGFVTRGNFSDTEGCGGGVGFVSFEALLLLLDSGALATANAGAHRGSALRIPLVLKNPASATGIRVFAKICE